MTKKSNSRLTKDVESGKIKSPGPTLTQAQEELAGDLSKIKKIVDNLKKTSNTFKDTFETINEKYNCAQFQFIVQDLESICQHIDSLETVGPQPAHEEIPLEQSELNETPETVVD